MSFAVAAKPEEKKKKAAARAPAQTEGHQWDEAAGARAGVPLFLGGCTSGACTCSECMARRVQARLVVGQIGDPYEQQADHVADRAAHGGAPSWMAKPLQPPGHSSSHVSAIPTADAGKPLEPDVRERVEPLLGADLSQVRIHGSEPDRKVARDMGAQAFTHGSHIWLGPAQSSSDIKLMAHEAAHVVQQGAASPQAPTVQRLEDGVIEPPPQAESARPDTGPIRQMLQQLPSSGRTPNAPAPAASPAAPHAAPAAAQTPTAPKDKPDPAMLAHKKSELRTIGQPAADHANRNQPRLNKAAHAAKAEAHKPANPGKGAKGAASAPKASAKPSGKKKSGGRGHGNGGVSTAGVQTPATPTPVQAPKIAAPVDSAGKPLSPDVAGDAGIVKLTIMAQAMRLKGFLLRQQAAQERHNAGVIQGNLNKVNDGIAQADEGIGKTDEHLTYRREVVSKAEGVLKVSEQKADMVASQAPKYQSTSAEGKAKSGPMSSEAGGLAAENASKAPDDEDAAEKSQEQGQKLNKVGSDIGSMDDAMTKTQAKADTLAGDAAQAKQKNAKTSQNVTATHGALDQTGAKVAQMQAQNASAQAQAAAHAGGPAQMAARAAALDLDGQAAIQASIQMEQRAHAAQQRYLDGMHSVPKSKLGGASPNPRPVLIQRQAEPGAPNPDERINLNLGAKVGDALPSWLTGEEKQTEEERAQAQADEKKRRQDEIKEISDKAGGDFSKLSAADKAGIALRLTGRHLFGSVAGIKWPNFLGKMLQGLVDPRMALMGVVSGLSMVLSGGANLISAEQWKKDPIGNLLKSAAEIATGITIVLGAITALAMAIIAILIAAAILTLGLLGPLAAAVIPFCTTVVATVGPWTMEAAAIALELNILVMIKDLIDAATAQTAEQLQGESDKVTEDAKQAGNMALQIGMAAVGEAGGEALASTEFGQGMAAGMRDIGEDFGIVKPAGGATAPPVEAAPVETSSAPPQGEAAAPAPKTDAAPVEQPSAPKAEAPKPAEPSTAPKTETPQSAEPATAPKAEAPKPAEPSTAPKAEAASAEPVEKPAAESKPAEPAEATPKPDDIAAEQPAADGHKVKVTKEGECLICTDCENAATVIDRQLEAGEVPPAEKAKIEGDLEKANEIQDPAQKAQATAEVQKEATAAVDKAQAEAAKAEPAKPPETPSESPSELPAKTAEPPAAAKPDAPEPVPGEDLKGPGPEEKAAPEETAPAKNKSPRESAEDEINDRIQKKREQRAAETKEMEPVREEVAAKARKVNEAYERAKAAKGEEYKQAIKEWKEAQAELKEANERLQGYQEKIKELHDAEFELKESLAAGKRRETYLGKTPGKYSDVGMEVQARMRANGTLKTDPVTGDVMFKASNDQWYPLEDADMSHYPVDAVSYWNETGRNFGPRSPEVRAWMTDARNYVLDHYSLNRSAGGSLGEEYLPPK
ncbi:MAG TPA: DUF4157 domain-containing protein [Terracidiphilus sp.]